jgi:hypothetical protein
LTNRKGAVPVIATMLLLTIVVASALVVYAYVSGATVLPDAGQHTGKMLEKLKTVEVKGFADGHFNVSIMNTGSVDSVIDVFYVHDFLGNTLTSIPVNVAIAVGETKQFIFDPFLVGQSPWSWYKIIAVTDRANKVTTNLYGFYSGAYELGAGPGENEYDYSYGAFYVTIDGAQVAPPNLENLTAIDGTTFAYPASNWTNAVVTYPSGAYDLDIVSGQYITHAEDIDRLSNFGSSTVLLFNIHDVYYFMSSIFNGTVRNVGYPELKVTFIFDMQNSGWTDLSGSFQFYDFGNGQYVSSGNGYFQFNGSSLPIARTNGYPSAPPGYRLVEFTVDATDLISNNGNWSVLLNMTSGGQDVVKLDYFSVTETVSYAYSFETELWYRAIEVTDENNVTQIMFTTTGTFPSGANYTFRAYDFDAGAYSLLGTIVGSPLAQTWIFTIDDSCSRYIDDSTNNVRVLIMPMNDLPESEHIHIDQARMILRQVEYN